MKTKIRLAWKKEEAERGLARVGAAPRGYDLRAAGVKYASVRPLGGGWRPLLGWYFVAGWDGGIAHFNSCAKPIPTVDEAMPGRWNTSNLKLRTNENQLEKWQFASGSQLIITGSGTPAQNSKTMKPWRVFFCAQCKCQIETRGNFNYICCGVKAKEVK